MRTRDDFRPAWLPNRDIQPNIPPPPFPHHITQSQWTSAKEGACAAVEKVKPDLSWLGKGA
jgi:hypothetical protein